MRDSGIKMSDVRSSRVCRVGLINLCNLPQLPQLILRLWQVVGDGGEVLSDVLCDGGCKMRLEGKV